MIKIYWRILIVLFLISPVFLNLNGQTRKLNKRTSKREIRKKQEKGNENSDYNKFNKLVPMGSRVSTDRNDFIWSYETANVVPTRGGDISLIGPSRISLRTDLEIGSSLASIPFIPMVFIKKKWKDDEWIVSSRHQLYSYYPLLYWLDKKENYKIIPEGNTIPQVLGIKNELIISRAFNKELNCGGVKQPFLIATLGVGYDYGLAFEGTDSTKVDNKFLIPRTGVVLGNNGFFQLRLQGDLYLNKGMFLTVAARGLLSDIDYEYSIEQNSSVRFMLSPRFSVNLGYWLSLGKGNGDFIVPAIDLTFHFGQRASRDKGLFKRGM